MIRLTIHGRTFTVLVDTGSDTNILKPNLLRLPLIKLNEPMEYYSLAGKSTIDHKIRGPIPLEFNCEGTMDWKIYPLRSNTYDGIMGVSSITAFEGIIDLKNFVFTTKNAKIDFYLPEIPIDVLEANNIEPISDSYNEIKKQINSDYLNSEEKIKLKKVLAEYKDLFYSEGEVLSCTNEVQHTITLSDPSPISCKIYRYPKVHEDEINRQISEMLKLGIIKESTSPYNGPYKITLVGCTKKT